MRKRLVCISLLILVVSAGAQDPTASTTSSGAPVFGETILVKVVNVDVYVTDRKGNPITGLTEADFEIFENKSEVRLSNFYEFREGTEVALPAEDGVVVEEEAPAPRRREDLFTSHPGLEKSTVPAHQRLNLVVYVDHFNITPGARNRLFRYLRPFLRTKMDRNDRVMLVSYNRSVKVERPFTSDPELIAAATYDLERHTGGRTTYMSERADLLDDIDDDQDRADYYSMRARVRLHAENVYNDLQFTVDGLNEVVSKMAGIPGRKALLYVSEGLQLRAAEDLFFALGERFREGRDSQAAGEHIMESMQFDASRMFTTLADLANANRVSFYNIDAAGLRVGGLRSAEYRGSLFSTNIDSVHTRNLQDTLLYLSDRTGGRAIVGTNNFLDGLSQIGSDFENYYSLGYSPAHSGSGRRYKIDVKLTKATQKRLGKTRLRYRDSYQDKPVRQEMGDATLATLAYGFQSNELGVRLVPRQQIRREKGDYLVSMDVRLPLRTVELIPSGELYHGKVRVWAQAIDNKGRTSNVQENRWPLQVKATDFERVRTDGSYMVYELKLVMRAGEQKVAIAVRDELTANASYISQGLTVGPVG
ncbi:MAG: VWA domain-containing protein [Acidobacteriota bacterium]|nr:VWA domain-containing protein [Acidobacteriota bacterium]